MPGTVTIPIEAVFLGGYVLGLTIMPVLRAAERHRLRVLAKARCTEVHA
jgi:hypothetical protein